MRLKAAILVVGEFVMPEYAIVVKEGQVLHVGLLDPEEKPMGVHQVSAPFVHFPVCTKKCNPQQISVGGTLYNWKSSYDVNDFRVYYVC